MINESYDNVPKARRIRRADFTKRRQKIDLLLKKAMKGDKKAKKLLEEKFGIRLYSAEEIKRYQE